MLLICVAKLTAWSWASALSSSRSRFAMPVLVTSSAAVNMPIVTVEATRVVLV